MILLSRLNKEKFWVNCEMIEFIEETPTTVISMLSGRKVTVLEPADEIRRLSVEYKNMLKYEGPIIKEREEE